VLFRSGINKVDNIFSWDELKIISDMAPTQENEIDDNLGRICIGDIKNSLSQKMQDKLYKIVDDITDAPLVMDHALYVEYNAKYGQPNLPPHFDGDTNDLIINIQLSSNTRWDLGLNLETHQLEDNSAMVFNGNTEIHWRPHKEFQDGEYVKMLFVRFYNARQRSNYDYLPMNQSDEVFKEVREYRDSLRDL
jgi:hypothetical protein